MEYTVAAPKTAALVEDLYILQRCYRSFLAAGQLVSNGSPEVDAIITRYKAASMELEACYQDLCKVYFAQALE